MGDNRSKGLQQNAILATAAAGKVSDFELRFKNDVLKIISIF